MFEIMITQKNIVFWLRTEKGETRRAYPNTPENYDALQRMLDNRAERPTPLFNGAHVFVRGKIGAYSPSMYATTDPRFYTVYWIMHNRNYRLRNGVAYDERTPSRVVDVLEMARFAGRDARLKITYDNDTESGYVSTRKVESLLLPQLLYNTRSSVGTIIWVDSISRIEYANKRGGGVLYHVE